MDQNWNNGANGGSMPAPNMGMDPNAVPNSGMNMNQQPMGDPSQQGAMPQMQQPGMQAPNMNMGGSAPVVNQPGVVAPPAPVATKNNGSVVETIILVIVCLVAAAAIVVAVMFYMKFKDLEENYTTELDSKVATAVAEEQENSAKKIEEEKKKPNLEFRGPEDYGSVSFQYPKTWSVYVDKDASDNGDFYAYFNPVSVPPTGNQNSRYALRFVIYNRQYDDVVKKLVTNVNNGKLKSQVFKANNGQISGTRFEGELESKVIGTLVAFKVNDKTAVLRTDSNVLMEDYEQILTTLRRNSN